MSDSGTNPPDRSASPALVGVVTGLAVVLLLLTVVTLLVALLHKPQGEALDQARTDALAAGRQVVVNLDALNAATLEADVKRVEPEITGTFKAQFAQAADTLRKLYPIRHTVSKGEIRSAAVLKADLNSVTLLIASDRTFTDVDNKDPVLQTSRYEAVMEKHGGTWLLADLEPVP